MSFPKYKYLLTYRYSEIIFDLNSEFCTKYINKMSRTFDQMIQASRSGKQNIVEAVGESDTTKKNEIKLLGYAKGSFDELLADYEDYARLNKINIYQKTDQRIKDFQFVAYRLSNLNNLDYIGNLKERADLPTTSVDAVNYIITLIHIETYLLDKQIKAMIEKFQKEGGFSEQLLKGRINKKYNL